MHMYRVGAVTTVCGRLVPTAGTSGFLQLREVPKIQSPTYCRYMYSTGIEGTAPT
jgi:hypothetical protein